MIRLFCGFDPREEPGLHVFIGSVLRHASCPVSIVPLSSQGLAQGSNEFTLSRFLVARLCDFKGHAIFCDGSDMLALADLVELDKLFDDRYAVQVVKHPDYISLHQRKYVGTELESDQSNYPRKNWASVMIVNCEHIAWRRWPYFPYHETRTLPVLQFKFLDDPEIGELPKEWNVLADEDQDARGAKLLHWTAGVPHFPHYSRARYAESWFKARDAAWQERRNF
jgi:hypothetical protein